MSGDDGFSRGISHLVSGFGLAFSPGIRQFALIPLAINTLLFIGFVYFGYTEGGALIDRWLGQFWAPIRWLLYPLLVLSLVLIWFYSFTIVANLIGAPFNGVLAAKVEQQLRPNEPLPEISFNVLIAVLGELRKLLYFLGLGVLVFILTLIPLINIAAPFLWFIFGAWMMVVEYADYPLGNHGISIPQQRDWLRQRRMMSLGFGAAASFSMLIPVVNLAVMPAAVAGATEMWVARQPKA